MSCNPIASLYLASSQTVNGRLSSGIGINFPKGAILACSGISFSKDGIANILSYYSLENALAARLIGLVDMLLTFILYPFMVAAYLIVILLALLSIVFLLPFACCSLGIKTFVKTICILALFSPISILAATVMTALGILEVIAPEFTCYILQFHKWGRAE